MCPPVGSEVQHVGPFGEESFGAAVSVSPELQANTSYTLLLCQVGSSQSTHPAGAHDTHYLELPLPAHPPLTNCLVMISFSQFFLKEGYQ